MSTILINNNILNEFVSNDMMPKRLDSASNLLIITNKGYLVFNTSPDIWKMWFPFYDDKNKYVINYEFKSNTYGELIKEYNDIYNNNAPDINKRIDNLKSLFIEKFNINNIEIDNNKLIEDIFQLRYSKTANMWTLYKIEYFIVKNIDSIDDVLKNSNLGYSFIPFNFDTNTLHVGMSIVDNMKPIINDKGLEKELNRYIINID